jgi:hypothetical protein
MLVNFARNRKKIRRAEKGRRGKRVEVQKGWGVLRTRAPKHLVFGF